jgi:hypothetical protein
MRGTGSGGIGFVVTSGTLLVIALLVLALLALGGWLLFRR